MHLTSTQIRTMLNHPAIKRRVIQPVRINTKYDVPGFAVCSKNGRTVYIDRQIKTVHKGIIRYAVLRKALRDIFNLHPFLAKCFAISEIGQNIKNIYPYINTIKTLGSPHLNLPPDIDTNIYTPQQKRTLRKKLRRKKAIDNAKKMSYDKRIKESQYVDRNIYEIGLSSLSKNKADFKNPWI